MSKIDKHLEQEEDYFGNTKRASRKERKQLSLQDRSKFKKSDQDQIDKRVKVVSNKDLTLGRILAITPEGAVVLVGQTKHICQIKGLFKKEKTKLKNLIAVGDIVYFDLNIDGTGVIEEITPRLSILSRADNLTRRKEQIIAVNVDILCIVVSVLAPALKPSLIDRYIIAAQKGNLRPIIVVNKIDLLKHPPSEFDQDLIPNEQELYDELVKTYTHLGFTVLPISVITGEGLKELKENLTGKTFVFSGQSGVGKTSLLNRLFGFTLPIGDVTEKTNKGSHTTTVARLIQLEDDSFCIDTPGIRSFGIWNLKQEELQHYFSEIATLSEQCKFPNCQHLQEPHCAVKQALDNGELSPLRFLSYCTLLMESQTAHKHR